MSFPDGTTEHPINKSGKRKILVSVWDFGAVHPQSERNHYLYNDHPAKMRPALARAILQLYGESPVLDPMAGIGTTLVEAMLLGMDAVGVELEAKFVNQANKNIRHIQKTFPNDVGNAICIQGDARDLSFLNTRKINAILTSPPYFNALKKGDAGPRSDNRRISYKERVRRFQGHSCNKGNIGNIPSFGPIIFSPPYCGVMDAKRHVGGIASRDPQLAKTGFYSKNEKNVGNLRAFGSIVFSPPYFNSLNHDELPTKTHVGYHKWQKRGDKTIKLAYSKDPSNIGNIAEFGTIVFSPPLGEYNRGGGIAKKGYNGKYGKDEKLKDRCDRRISQDKNNISNSLYGRTYLGEMFKVYSECYRVLKPNKFMVVVVKDIRRRGLTIPLGADTIKLCQMAGFELFDIIINKMYFPSFWQLNHAQKTQAKGIPMTLRTHEYVLIFRKHFN